MKYEMIIIGKIELRKLGHSVRDNVWIWDISFLSAETVMVTTDYSVIFLVSVESGQCISHCQIENPSL